MSIIVIRYFSSTLYLDTALMFIPQRPLQPQGDQPRTSPTSTFRALLDLLISDSQDKKAFRSKMRGLLYFRQNITHQYMVKI